MCFSLYGIPESCWNNFRLLLGLLQNPVIVSDSFRDCSSILLEWFQKSLKRITKSFWDCSWILFGRCQNSFKIVRESFLNGSKIVMGCFKIFSAKPQKSLWYKPWILQRLQNPYQIDAEYFRHRNLDQI